MLTSSDIIILAAGSSGRLGRPKQLLPYKGKTLLQYLIDEAKASTANSVTIILGANAEMIQAELQRENIFISINHDWKEGMASSVRCGINSLKQTNAGMDAVILMMCDQPFVTTGLLNDLMTLHQESGKPIVTCSFEKTSGPPALFHKSIFPELLQLTGDKGARKIVEAHEAELVTIPFPEGNIDIDTAADYEALQRKQ
ncbi:MAG: nucleotidyltransferase family protein [Bacteroidota bacterium]